MSLDDFNNEKNDLESALLQQFSCMSTNNKDDLIRDFQRLLAPNQLSPEGCAFFLSMANWNLQNAICSYFDYDAHKLLQQPLPQVTLLGDVTIGEGEEVPPVTRFVKTWKLANSGTTVWPPGCFLTFLNGHRMGSLSMGCSDRVLVDSLKPGESTNVSVSMVSPNEPGTYQGQWRMCTSTGQYFGDIIWCIISVAEGGLLSLTQQMSSFNALGSTNSAASSENPFVDHTNSHTNHPAPMNPFESNMPNNLQQQQVQRDAEMQIDEDNQNR